MTYAAQPQDRSSREHRQQIQKLVKFVVVTGRQTDIRIAMIAFLPLWDELVQFVYEFITAHVRGISRARWHRCQCHKSRHFMRNYFTQFLCNNCTIIFSTWFRVACNYCSVLHAHETTALFRHDSMISARGLH